MNFSILGIRDSPECGGDGLLAGYGWGYGWSWWWEGWVEALVRVMRLVGLVVLVLLLALRGTFRRFASFRALRC